jgi:hypothetical protein
MILIVFLAIAVGYIFATALNRNSVGQPPAPEAVAQEGQVWRYQLMQSGDSSSVFLTDTVNGRVWCRGLRTDSEWQALGSPAERKQDALRR